MNAARISIIVFIVAAVAGAVFSGVSTYDFVQLLDRQVHGAHCSFIPGLAGDHSGSSGCDVALMSPYSSAFRTLVWGGLPVALPGLALFTFLAARAVPVLLEEGSDLKHSAGFLFAASIVPAFTSVVMGSIAFFALETLCKSCMGIYIASFVCLGASTVMLATSGAPRNKWADDDDPAPSADDDMPRTELPKPAEHVGWTLIGGLSVVLPCLLYLALVPDFSERIGTCGALSEPEDRYGVMLELGEGGGGVDTIEVFDPLCPACKSMEDRLEQTGFDKALNRKLVLFPLDDSCNWMLSEAIHPGACVTSEAVLCAGDDAEAVLEWAFDNQEQIKALATGDSDKAVAKLVGDAFPSVKSCLGSAKVKQRLNRSLRWAVNNSLQILTPQLFIDGVGLCQEDTDIGLSYTLSHMVERAHSGTLAMKERSP